MGTWSHDAEDVPVTEKAETFAPATDRDEWNTRARGESVGKLLPADRGAGYGGVGDAVSERNFF
jgi:hypothetical protein